MLEITDGKTDQPSLASRQFALMNLAALAASKGHVDYAVDAYRNIIR